MPAISYRATLVTGNAGIERGRARQLRPVLIDPSLRGSRCCTGVASVLRYRWQVDNWSIRNFQV